MRNTRRLFNPVDVSNIVVLQKAYEDLKNSMNDIFLNHQKDVKLVKAKKDQEIESIQRSLDCTSKLLKDQEKNYKKEKSELQQKFDQKVGEMDKYVRFQLQKCSYFFQAIQRDEYGKSEDTRGKDKKGEYERDGVYYVGERK